MILAFLAWFGALSTSVDSPGPPPEPLHPHDHRSADERWVLHIDPSRRDGKGPAECRMSRSGELVWARHLPFTLSEACVTNEGSVIGYAHAYLAPYEGELTLVILGPDGSERLVERAPSCNESGRIRNLPERLELFEREDRALLRLARRNLGLHEWRLYLLSSGTAIGRFETRPASLPDATPDPALARPGPVELSFDGLPQLRLLPAGEVVFRDPGRAESELRFEQLDTLGRILLVDQATFSVLAFSEQGALLLRAQLEPDLGRGLASSLPRWVAVSPGGGLLVRVKKGLVEFDREGRRLGRTGEDDWSAPQELPWREGGRSWELDLYDGHIELHDAEGLVLATCERGAHDRWMRSLRSPVLAPDGSLAVLDASYGEVMDLWLHVFDGEGRALTSVALPPTWSSTSLAYDGVRIALLAERRILLLDRSGAITGWAQLPEGWDPHEIACGPHGELWLFDGPRMRRCLVP